MAFLLGLDVGSSSIKATLLDAETGKAAGAATSPQTELPILAERPGWAEQHPDVWWEHVRAAVGRAVSDADADARDIAAVGIAYQMHGLVLVDEKQRVLRPAILWCDSRAVGIGGRAFREIGKTTCLERLLNSPGNFTASKLKWVMDHEPQTFARTHKAMLPGDYLTMRMTGEVRTTPSGLSEMILWDFRDGGPATLLLDHYGIPYDLLPDVVPTFSVQGELTREAADELGLAPGTPVSYRAGDQPNNALSLHVLQPGEVAATAGTSGVVYAVTDEARCDPESRVNTFVHVNHTASAPRCGVLLCINGAGILNRWLRQNAAGGAGYDEMNSLASQAPVGCDGLVILPYGNGAERTLGSRDIGASVHGLHFSVHGLPHVLRATQEGVAFALNYGLDVLRGIAVDVRTVRAGRANLFLSPLFCEAFAAATGTRVELFDTDGSQGAARGAGVGAGIYRNLEDAFAGLAPAGEIEPSAESSGAYQAAYAAWLDRLTTRLGEMQPPAADARR